jgi:hypothetical protein
MEAFAAPGDQAHTENPMPVSLSIEIALYEQDFKPSGNYMNHVL